MAACAVLGWFRSKIAFMNMKSEPVPNSLTVLLLGLYLTQSSLLVISAIILGDALRMLSVQFKKDPRLKVNQRTMSLHVLALFLHTFFMVFH
jgi:hypothetical protein